MEQGHLQQESTPKPHPTEEAFKTKAQLLRRKAEKFIELIKNRTKNSLSFQPNEIYDISQLLEELSILQIELELQNRELDRVKNNLEIKSQSLKEFFDYAPTPILCLSSEGRILNSNQAAREIIFRVKIPSKTIDNLFHCQLSLHNQKKWNAFLEKIKQNNFAEIDISFHFKSLPTLFFHAVGKKNSLNEIIVYFFPQNISDSYSEWKFTREIVENSGFGFYIFHLEKPNDDKSLRLLYANERTWKLTGVAPELVIGKRIDEAYPNLRKQNIPNLLLKVARGILPAQKLEVHYSDENVKPGDYSVTIFSLPNFRVGVCVENITQKKKIYNQLQQYQQGLEILIHLALNLLHANELSFDKAINDSLARLGGLVDADRAYVFCLDSSETTISCTHEWCAEGISSVLNLYQNCPLEYLTDNIDNLGAFSMDVSMLPKNNPLRDSLEQQNVKSIFNYPIYENGKFVGLVGFDSVRVKRNFSEFDTNLLKIFGELFFAVRHRIQADKKLAHLLEDYHTLLLGSPTVLCKISPKGKILSVSENCEKILGFSASQLLGKKARLFVAPADRQLCKNFLLSLARPNRVSRVSQHSLDIQVKTPQGFTWFRLSASAVLSPTDRSLSYFILNLRNIADEKKFHEQIRNLTLVSEITDNVIIITDARGKITWVNDAFTRFTGYTFEEAKGKSPSFLQGPRTDPAARERMRKAMLAGEGFVEEVLNYKKNGEPYWVKLNVNPQRNAEGAIVGWVSLQTDITELRQREQLLRESEERFRTLANDLPALVCEFLPDSTLTFVNNAYAEYFGRKPEQLLGKSFREFIPPEEFEELQKFLKALRPDQPTGKFVHRVIRNGIESWQEWHERAVFDEYGRLLKFQSIGTDITDRKRYEEKLREASERALEATRAKSAFLANMSHEIRTPLSGILGLADLLLKSKLNPEQQRHATLLRNSATSLLGILNDILDLSKIEAGHIQLKPTPIDLQQTLRNLVEEWQIPAAEKGLSLRLTLEPNLPQYVLADRTRLRQILLNLLSNALKFTSQGGIHLRATALKIENETALIRFEVMDSGIGIEPERIPQLFDRFVQADASISRKFGGTGLGLAICRELVQLMKGKIGAESAPGQGSTFWFEIPLQIVKQPSITETHFQDFKPLLGHVLLVEDFAPNQIVLEQTLLDFGLTVEVADSGPAALEKLMGERFDLVLMDVQMPGMDGLETARRVRSSSGGRTPSNVPILALTAHALTEDRQRCIEAGMNDYLSKPIEREKLYAALRNWLPLQSQQNSPPEPASTSLPQATSKQLSASPRQKLFDNSLVLRSVNGKIASWIKFAKATIDSLDEQIPKFSEAISQNDCAAIRASAHKIKGLAGYLQSTQLEELARRVELAAKNSDLQTPRTLAPEILSQATALRQALQEEVEKNPAA